MDFISEEETQAIMLKKPRRNATQEEINRLDEEQQDAYNRYIWTLAKQREKTTPDWDYYAGKYEKRIVSWGSYTRPFILNESTSSKIDINGDNVCVFSSVDQIPDSYFTIPQFSVLLPPFSAKIAYTTGYPSKEILIKKVIFEKNIKHHRELKSKPTDSKRILKNAIYYADRVIFRNMTGKPDYRTVARFDNMYCIANLDFTPSKPYTEVVGWYMIDIDDYNDIAASVSKMHGYILDVPKK